MKLQGSMVALVTPMLENGALDWPRLDQLVEFHMQQGTDAIVAVGTTGESATLDTEEHCAVIRHIVTQVAGRVPVIAGTGANATKEAIELTACAKAAGADACLLVTPYYNKPTQNGLYLHHKAVAEAVDIPQILYNVPGRTACDMKPETVIRLSSVRNIIGIKEATGDLARVKQIQEGCGGDFLIFSGDDATARELMLLGGHGVISVTANVAPKQMHQMCMAALDKDPERAIVADRVIEKLHHSLFVEANPIPVKWALYRMGLIEKGIRLPLTMLSENFHSVIESDLKAAGLI